MLYNPVSREIGAILRERLKNPRPTIEAVAPTLLGPKVDMAKPTIKPFETRLLGNKSWGTETLFAHTETYIGKVLRMRAGASGPLQYHERKDETFYLLSGRAMVRFDRGDGVLGVHQMLPGEAFHIPPGAVHQVQALEECVFVEASNPVFEDRVNVEANYR